MSHKKYRKENNCLNCNAIVDGNFCKVCGQENVEPAESFGHLIQHFLYDITHFDGKFFYSLKYLFLRPGYLSYEYIKGRRNNYLNPIKMYVFTSAIFFLLQGTVFKKDEKAKVSSITNPIVINFDTSASENTKIDTLPVKDSSNYKTLEGYYFYQKNLPADKKDNFIARMFTEAKLKQQKKYGYNDVEFGKAMKKKATESIPKQMIIFLPILALLLKLFFRKSKFLYVQHLIFCIHLFVFYYIDITLIDTLDIIKKSTSFLQWLYVIKFALIFYMLIYTHKALRYFYANTRFKTILKLFSLISISIFFFGIIFFTAFSFILFLL